MDKPEKLLRTAEVAELLAVSPKTVTRYAVQEGLPVAKETALGGHRRYYWSQVAAWVEQQRPRKEAIKQARRDKARETHTQANNGPQPDSSTPIPPVPAGGLNRAGRAAP